MLLFFLGFSIDSLSDIFFLEHSVSDVILHPQVAGLLRYSTLYVIFFEGTLLILLLTFFFFFFLEHSVSDVNCKNSSIDYRRVFADRITGAPSKGYILFLFVMFSLQRMMHSQVRGLGPNARNAALSSLMD